MKKYYISLIVLIGLLVGFATSISADMHEDQLKVAQELRLLKIQISTLMLEKKQLEEQQVTLQSEYSHVKKQFAEVMRDVIAVDADFLKDRQLRVKHERMVRDLGFQVDDIQDEYLIQKFKNAYLSRELIDKKELHSLRRLQLSDLQLQKRDLELDVKWREFERDEASFKAKEELVVLQRNLQKNITKARELTMVVSQVDKGQSLAPRKKALENRRGQLTEKYKQLKERLQILQESKIHLEDNQRLAKKSFLAPLKQKRAVREELKIHVEDLEEQYRSLSSVVQESFSRKKRFQSLMEEMVILDRENQLLRKRIGALETHMTSVKN